jgi:hypothetical protein
MDQKKLKLHKEIKIFIKEILIKIKTIEDNNKVKECVLEAKNIFEVKI